MSGLKKYFPFIGVVAALLMLGFLRRPDIFLHAQFWAEDGRVWYAEAHNLGFFQSLILVQDGYFQTLARITAGVAQLVPLGRAPLVFNSVAFVVNILPAVFIVSPRFRKLIPSFFVRVLLGLLLILLPNTAEVYGNLTNAQWYLALLGLLIILTDAPLTRIGKIFDYCMLFLVGLSGPFTFFLLPVTLIQSWRDRTVRAYILTVIIGATSVVQAMALFFISSTLRSHAVDEISFYHAVEILIRQVVMGATLGGGGYSWLVFHLPALLPIIFWSMGVLAGCLELYAMYKGPVQLKLAIIFGVMIFGASLVSPTLPKGQNSAFSVLFESTGGARYWLIPMMIFVFVIIWSTLKGRWIPIRIAGVLFLISMMVGLVTDFRHPQLVNLEFERHVQGLNNIPVGSYGVIPINPYTWWTMVGR